MGNLAEWVGAGIAALIIQIGTFIYSWGRLNSKMEERFKDAERWQTQHETESRARDEKISHLEIMSAKAEVNAVLTHKGIERILEQLDDLRNRFMDRK
ncbi:MAG: hypothetical protein KGI66_01040 [Patescibacteria group bacterium]|nr:hypothetical protein [Patescibacteria group bacterium]